MKKEFSRTEFVTVNFVKDWLNGIKDILGMEQKSYGDVVNKKSKEMFEEIKKEGDIIWFRQEIDRTFDKSLQITIYGQLEQRVE